MMTKFHSNLIIIYTVLYLLCNVLTDWKQIKDPSAAATLFRSQTLGDNEGQKSLIFVMDLHSDIADREKAVIGFYKTSIRNWASPLKCILEGNFRSTLH